METEFSNTKRLKNGIKKKFFKFIFDSNAETERSARIIFKLLFYKKTEKTIPFD